MGAYLAHPITKTVPEEGSGNNLEFGASCMQGWRVSQEDAHNCIVDFDENSSLFAVYDGHGGSEIAAYLSKHFPQFVKDAEAYKSGDFGQALSEAYLKIDESIKTAEGMKEIVRLSKTGSKDPNSEEFVDEDVKELYEEATMPLEDLIAKYQSGGGNGSTLESLLKRVKEINSEAAEDGEKPGSSSKLIKLMLSSVTSQRLASASESIEDSNSKEKSENEEEGLANSSTPATSTSTKIEEITSSTIVIEEESAGGSSSEKIVIEKREEVEVTNGEISSTSSTSLEEHKKEENGTSSELKSPIVLNGGGDEKKETIMNGETEVSNGDNDKEVSENDVSMTSVASSEESEVPKKKKGKNHPPPPIPRPAVEEKRTSPRKKDVDETGTYLKFIHKNPEDMTESSSDEEEDPSVHGEESDEDDDDDEDDEEEGDEEDEEGEEEESSDEEDYEEAEDDELLSNIQEPGYDSGATAVMAVMKWTPENKLSLWVANAGDSRCVVSRNGTAVEMSVDHKPEDIEECRRIVKAGGKVTAEGRVNGGLNLSRAIGDHSYKCNPSLPLKEQMITSFPDVQQLELSPGTDEFLVLACDGIWNSMSSQEVVDFVGQRLKDPAKIPLSQICDELFKTCLAEDTGGDGTGCDNMTAIIVRILDPKDKTSCGVKRPLNGSILEENEAKKIKTSEDTD